jgi:hypothetical protein
VTDYAPPPPAKQGFPAARARVIVTDARLGRELSAQRRSGRHHDADLPRERLEALGPELAARVALSGNAGELVFVVRVVEAAELGASTSTVRAVLDVTVQAEGKTIVRTRGTSTLVGWIGGQDPRDSERIVAAVFDAFERSVVRAAVIERVNTALARDEPEVALVEPVEESFRIAPHESTCAAHLASAVVDVGESRALGLRYLHDHLRDGFWAGYGAEGRVISADFARVDAVAALAVARAGMGLGQPHSIELGFGLGGRDALRGVGVAGVYFSFYRFELGFTYQFVINPTPELEGIEGPHFGLRVYVPVSVHNITVRCRSPLPCKEDCPCSAR